MSRLVMLIAAVLVVAGCNTVAGLGKDMEAAGGAVEKAANRGKKN
jgi:predicted small secreted protein